MPYHNYVIIDSKLHPLRSLIFSYKYTKKPQKETNKKKKQEKIKIKSKERGKHQKLTDKTS